MKRIAFVQNHVRRMLPVSRVGRWTVWTLATALALMLGAVATYRIAMLVLGPPPFASVAENSRLVVDRDGRLLRPFTTSTGLWRLPVKLEDIDPRYVKMLLAYEDKRFYEHDGVDYRAMMRAVWQLISNGHGVSGGSTLTMQVARLLDKRPTHSYVAKVGQVFRAWQLESMMSKEEILELYMRIAPFGGNIEGVRAASIAYFGKEPKHLTVAEAALLVSLPQSPEERRPDRGRDITRIARNMVIDRVAAAGVISQAEADFAKLQPIEKRRHSFPALAAHLSERLVAASNDDVLRLTLKARLQQGVETIARRHVIEVGPKLSVAVMVVDHQTGEVLADVGSAGYFDNDRNGPIDMTQAVRSPGSALKPFIYGLGFEAGLAHPETLIEDRPTHFGRYAPSNFDNGYRGTVTVRQALQFSLNVPAVKMLAAVSPARLSSRIRHAGFKFEVPRNLAVALGGVGLRLEDLTGLYVALARGGEPVTLRYQMKPGEGQAHPDDIAPTSSERPLLSPLAAWYVGNILRGAPPPPHAKGGGIAFKTGTSYGFRDAWAAGFDGRYVVAVWIGRPDSTPTPGLMGLTEAAPLLFDVFAQIGPNRVPPPSPPQDALFASTASLPPPLKHFREVGTAMAGQLSADPAKPPVRITFPPDRAELEIAHELDGSPTPIAFQVEGGALPFTWLVNDVPLDVPPHRRQVFWTPRAAGFVQFSVIDAEGKVDRVTVRLR